MRQQQQQQKKQQQENIAIRKEKEVEECLMVVIRVGAGSGVGPRGGPVEDAGLWKCRASPPTLQCVFSSDTQQSHHLLPLHFGANCVHSLKSLTRFVVVFFPFRFVQRAVALTVRFWINLPRQKVWLTAEMISGVFSFYFFWLIIGRKWRTKRGIGRRADSDILQNWNWFQKCRV